MTGVTRAIEPFGFFSVESLRAGWYLARRLLVVVLPVLLVSIVAAGLVGARGLWLAAALIALAGVLAAAAAAVRVTNRAAGAWALGEYGRPLPRGVWWSVTWRVLLVSVPLSLLLTPLSLFSQDPLFVSGAVDLVLPIVGLLLAAFYVVVTLQSYGWAMSVAAADRLGAVGALDGEMDDPDEPAPARARRPIASATVAPRRAAAPPPLAAPRLVAAPRAAAPARRTPRPARRVTARPPASPPAAMQCARCGLRETERGSVIGWYCRVCGWREKRA